MVGSGIFPKVDGDILYAYDVNQMYNYPRVLYSGTTFNFSFNPTSSSGLVRIDVVGQITSQEVSNFAGGVGISLNGSSIDTASFNIYSAGTNYNVNLPYSLLGVIDYYTSGQNVIGSITSGGGYSVRRTMVMEYLR